MKPLSMMAQIADYSPIKYHKNSSFKKPVSLEEISNEINAYNG